MSYKAKVCHISTRSHPNADRVQLGVASGYQVVVGLEVESGQLGVYFPCDGQLSHEMCMANELYRKDPKTGEPMGGYFEENRRVRAQPFRGQKSEGFWVPLTYLRWTGVDLSTLEAGDEFDTLNGKEVCHKYVSEATKRAMERAQKQGQEKKKKEIPMFKKHFDTPKLRYTASAIPEGAVLHITEKLHGTCLSPSAMITMADGSKKRITQVEADDYVLGYDTEEFVLKPSRVVKTWNHGRNEGDWVKIKFSRKGVSGSHFGSIFTTPEHLVWRPAINDYCEAQSLKPGNKLLFEKFDRGPTFYQEQAWDVSEVFSMRPITMTQEVLSVHRKSASDTYVGTTKYDLTTETSNFFADGILVHNSGRTGYVQVEEPLPAIKRAINNFFRKEIFKPKREWRKVSGSRRVTYDPDQSVDQGYYSGMEFRFEIHDRLRLKKGETLYYEIVGFTDKKTPIMASHKITDKSLKKKYGDEMVYKYGTDRDQAVPYDIYVYRITQTNEDGDSVDLSWPKVMARCNELGLRHVPHYDTLVYDGDEDSFLELVEQYSQGSSKLDSTHIREGVCITVDHHLMGGTHKYKGFWFCELEGIAKNSDEYVDLEDIS